MCFQDVAYLFLFLFSVFGESDIKLLLLKLIKYIQNRVLCFPYVMTCCLIAPLYSYNRLVYFQCVVILT